MVTVCAVAVAVVVVSILRTSVRNLVRNLQGRRGLAPFQISRNVYSRELDSEWRRKHLECPPACGTIENGSWPQPASASCLHLVVFDQLPRETILRACLAIDLQSKFHQSSMMPTAILVRSFRMPDWSSKGLTLCASLEAGLSKAPWQVSTSCQCQLWAIW